MAIDGLVRGQPCKQRRSAGGVWLYFALSLRLSSLPEMTRHFPVKHVCTHTCIFALVFVAPFVRDPSMSLSHAFPAQWIPSLAVFKMTLSLSMTLDFSAGGLTKDENTSPSSLSPRNRSTQTKQTLCLIWNASRAISARLFPWRILGLSQHGV